MNHLIHETSPYLLQHAHNPVNWYPWGEEALQKAREENKILLISIGYAACHWCHVMERESFENKEIAEIMNRHFICIKVDREERPDIDQVYMNAVQLMTGQGGWPLNCFALPDGRPFYGGTYFQPHQWERILSQLAELYHNSPEEVIQYAEKLSKGIAASEMIAAKEAVHDFNLDLLKEGVQKWSRNFDKENGGHIGAPKFPLPNNFLFLLRYFHITQDKNILEHITLSLEKMARGGIYDQLGGGFARYTVDARWRIPHFEKMLYDNAQLISVYSEAYRLTQNPLYKKAVGETMEFIEREMASPEGGFYSSYDADSEGVEGKYYCWTKQEITDLLGDDASLFAEVFSITGEGNWEGTNILYLTRPLKEIAEKYALSEETLNKKLDRAKQILFHERKKRIKPGLDDKILTSWNALMLKACIDAYLALSEEKFLQLAQKNGEFLLKNTINKQGRITRNHKNGVSHIPGFLDDYSFTIEAFMALYQVTFDEKWLDTAAKIMGYVKNHFYDPRSGMFFYTPDTIPVTVTRKMELPDNVIPSSNSSLAKSLYFLGIYSDREEYIRIARQMASNMAKSFISNTPYYTNWGILLNFFINPPYEVVITGEKALNFRKDLMILSSPDILFAGGTKESQQPLLQGRFVKNKTLIYVCRNKTCQLPADSVTDVIKRFPDIGKD